MLDEQLEFDRIGVVEIDLQTFLERQIRRIAIVGVLWQNSDFAGRQLFDDFAHYGRFSGAGATGNTNNQHRNKYLGGLEFRQSYNKIFRFPK